MAERGLRALEAKNYVPRTSDGKADKPSPNRLLNAVIPTAPDTVWAGDITFIPTTAGWLDLAVVIDLCSRRILAWSTADNLRADLVADAFQQAVKSRRPKSGLVSHSDRGSQHGSKLFRG
ncbi:MAG: DDE-type integrase/transposase/recombinase [Verrucomicrobiales bacterium]|jgi:putative transposase|nr:DDE-type integrase/transposase/recombinase [Verrucomicrobiales bacterium]